uniref:Uncharacterized protein n=1 Tax=Setaria italica TaxID=4555 RepID=K3XP55_SETIT
MQKMYLMIRPSRARVKRKRIKIVTSYPRKRSNEICAGHNVETRLWPNAGHSSYPANVSW